MPMAVKEILQRRRSVRRFEPDGLLLTRESIEALIEDACAAPSDHNLQPWRFIVVRDRARKEDLYDCAGKQEKVRQASAVVIVCGDAYAERRAPEEARDRVSNGSLSPADEARFLAAVRQAYEGNDLARFTLAVREPSFAAMALMLLATERGIGSTPIGHFDAGALRRAFGIPERYFPVLLVALGLPALDGEPLPPRVRMPASRVVFHEGMGGAEP
jgi:nitroreductase